MCKPRACIFCSSWIKLTPLEGREAVSLALSRIKTMFCGAQNTALCSRQHCCFSSPSSHFDRVHNFRTPVYQNSSLQCGFDKKRLHSSLAAFNPAVIFRPPSSNFNPNGTESTHLQQHNTKIPPSFFRSTQPPSQISTTSSCLPISSLSNA